jgi:membrane-associated protease RseP (regulator of RpoE activity)
MKCAPFVLTFAIWGSAIASSALAQPLLNRVEQFVRDQIGAVQAATQPPAAAAPGYLGLTADDRQDNGRAVRVDEVVPGGPASKAGLQKGDLILSIGGLPIRSMDDMARALQNQTEGTRLVFAIKRGNAQRQDEVILGRRPTAQPGGPTPAAGPATEELPAPAQSSRGAANGAPAGSSPIGSLLHPGASVLAQGPRLGVRTVNVSNEARQQNDLPDDNGAVVVGVTEGSPAARAGIPNGAVIVAFDNKPVNNPQDLATAVRASGGRDAEVVFIHGGQASRKNVSFAAAAPAGPAKLELRARPIEPPARPRPSDEAGPVLVAPADTRTAELEARIRELEERIAKLEAERQNEKGDAK